MGLLVQSTICPTNVRRAPKRPDQTNTTPCLQLLYEATHSPSTLHSSPLATYHCHLTTLTRLTNLHLKSTLGFLSNQRLSSASYRHQSWRPRPKSRPSPCPPSTSSPPTLHNIPSTRLSAMKLCVSTYRESLDPEVGQPPACWKLRIKSNPPKMLSSRPSSRRGRMSRVTMSPTLSTIFTWTTQATSCWLPSSRGRRAPRGRAWSRRGARTPIGSPGSHFQRPHNGHSHQRRLWRPSTQLTARRTSNFHRSTLKLLARTRKTSQ